MRSARMILATTAATAALAFSAPAAQAAGSGDRDDGGDSSYSSNDSRFDPDSYKGQDDEDEGGKQDQGGKQQGGKGKDQGGSSWGDDEESDRPHGGMHTGGGALASPGVTAGGLAVLGVAGTGAYALRRRRVPGSAS
ncbi:hypothetical protein [Streptomyces sp900105755]|uniref:Gram-positive cocci surface proteins LPxTG domain-containing protein n=1 Tax=Streptomyces sp. 900105755 TaxID=3154389 RepID=A0ABV1TU63_9ACTN